jgi:hypothetical protein
MRYFLDTEFLEDGKTIDMISIGIVAEDGRMFYRVSSEFDVKRVHADAWLKANVTDKLFTLPADTLCVERGSEFCAEELIMTRKQIREQLLDLFIKDDTKPSFYAWYASYDWIALCQLFGRMLDLPKHFPKYVHDLKQDVDRIGFNGRPHLDKKFEHNALHDAIWLKRLWNMMRAEGHTV